MEGIDFQVAIQRIRELQHDIQEVWERYRHPENPIGVPGQSPEEVARLFQEFIQALVELEDLLTEFLGPEKEIEYQGERIRVRGPLPERWRESTSPEGELVYASPEIPSDLDELFEARRRMMVLGAIPPWWPKKRPPVP